MPKRDMARKGQPDPLEVHSPNTHPPPIVGRPDRIARLTIAGQHCAASARRRRRGCVWPGGTRQNVTPPPRKYSCGGRSLRGRMGRGPMTAYAPTTGGTPGPLFSVPITPTESLWAGPPNRGVRAEGRSVQADSPRPTGIRGTRCDTTPAVQRLCSCPQLTLGTGGTPEKTGRTPIDFGPVAQWQRSAP